jgi:hypothetical protein
MFIGHMAFWCFSNLIDRLEDAAPPYWHLLVEFCLVRPAILLWLSFCFWPSAWVERQGSSSNFQLDYGLLELIVPRHILRIATDSRLSLVWASALAMASYSREVKIAPRNARLAGLLFCGILAIAFPQRDDRLMLFLVVVASCWAFPAAERYHHHSGRRRRLGFYVGDDSPGQEGPSPPLQRTRTDFAVPRPGTAFG